MKTAFLTGITGMVGSHLAEQLLEKGYKVHGLVRRSSTPSTSRIDHLEDLQLHYGDLTDGTNLVKLIRDIQPDEIYHLGAFSDVRLSFESPEYTLDANATGTMRLLEAARIVEVARFYNAATSELFGGLNCPETGYTEESPLNPRSPYGVSKLAAYHATKNYREAYEMFAASGFVFNTECVTAETPIIFRRNNWIDIAEIQELVAHRTDPRHGRKYKSFPKDLEIFDGDKWSRVTAAVATWNAGEKDIYEVEARGGFYRATADHKSFLEGRAEIETKDLKCGDRLQLFPLPTDLRNEKAIISLEEAEFLGLMTGDGYVAFDGSAATFTNKDEALLARSAELFTRLTGGKARKNLSKVSGITGETMPAMEFSGASKWFSFWRAEIYNERRMKKVPKRVLNAPLEQQHAFLSGYNAADGLKSKTCLAEFKCWGTNSPVLAAGLCFLAECRGLRVAINVHPQRPEGFFSLNVGDWLPKKGAHLLKPLEEVKTCKKTVYTGWLFDLTTESGTFSAGIGRTWVHNSPLRGENFVTKKIARAVARIEWGLDKHVKLGNLSARRDWSYAPEVADAIYRIVQHSEPDDFVIATGVAHSVQEFCEAAFSYRGLNWQDHVLFDPHMLRPTEVPTLIGDASKAKRLLGWTSKVSFGELVKKMVDFEIERIENGQF